jgi:hypothetical protein
MTTKTRSVLSALGLAGALACIAAVSVNPPSGGTSASVTNAIGTVRTNGGTIVENGATALGVWFGPNLIGRGTNTSGRVDLYLDAPTNGGSGEVTTDQLNTASNKVLVAFSNSTTLYVSPYGNDATAFRGRSDLPYSTFTNAFNALTNGDTLRVLPGLYTNRVQVHAAHQGGASANLVGKTNILLDFSGAMVYCPSNLSSFQIIRCKDVVVRGGYFDQQREEWPYPAHMTNGHSLVYGVWEVADSDGIHAREMTIVNAWDHGWLVDSPTNTIFNTNGSVIGCTFKNCGGMYFAGAYDGDAIIPGAGWIIANNTIVNCNRGIEQFPALLAVGIPRQTFPATVITGNKIYNVRDHAIAVYYTPATIVGNSCWNTNSDPAENQGGIQVYQNPGPSVVSGNTIKGFLNGIEVSSGTNVIVSGNGISECNYALRINKSVQVTLLDNQVVRSVYGIGMNDSDGLNSLSEGRISGNTFTDCNGWGTLTCNDGIRNVQFFDNRFNNTSNTASTAIWLTGTQSGNSFWNNSFSGYVSNYTVTGVATNVYSESGLVVNGGIQANSFSGPATGQGTLSVKGLITSETNRGNYFVITNELTVGTINVIGAIANVNALTNSFATRTLGITVSGSGSAITTGVKGVLEVPYACTIKQATVLALNSGAIVFDVWKTNYANYPPVIGGTITASAKPTITATGNKAQDATLTGWTTALAAGDILLFNVDSCTSITNASLFLKVSVP